MDGESGASAAKILPSKPTGRAAAEKREIPETGEWDGGNLRRDWRKPQWGRFWRPKSDPRGSASQTISIFLSVFTVK